MIDDVIAFVSACVVDARGRVLLVKRAPGKSHAGKWVTPGGGVEPGESELAATVRELGEECGLNLCQNDVGGFVYTQGVLSTSKRPGAVVRVTCRRVDYAPHMGEVRLKLDEVDGYGWFSPEEIFDMSEARLLGPADDASWHDIAYVGWDARVLARAVCAP